MRAPVKVAIDVREILAIEHVVNQESGYHSDNRVGALCVADDAAPSPSQIVLLRLSI